jgi:hypothetical protein
MPVHIRANNGAGKMKKLLIAGLLVFAASSQAAELSGVPTGWKIENYIPGQVVIWFSGSLCANGQLLLGKNATEGDKSRLYATIMNAKIAGSSVYVKYDEYANCQIQSFALN